MIVKQNDGTTKTKAKYFNTGGKCYNRKLKQYETSEKRREQSLKIQKQQESKREKEKGRGVKKRRDKIIWIMIKVTLNQNSHNNLISDETDIS